MSDLLDDLNGKRKDAQAAYDTVQELGQSQVKAAILMGKVLKDIRDRKLWAYMGDGGFSTFQSFLSNPEINIKISTAYSYMDIYSYYVEQKQMPVSEVAKIPFHRLQEMLSYLKKLNDPEKEEELIEQVKTLSPSDFNKELVDKKIVEPRYVRVFRHEDCGKACVEYYPEDVCSCDGTPYIRPVVK